MERRSKIILNQTSKHPEQKKTRCTEPPTQLNLYTIENRLYPAILAHISLSLSLSSSPINRGLKFHYSAKRPPAIFAAQPLPDKQSGIRITYDDRSSAGNRRNQELRTEPNRTAQEHVHVPRNTDSSRHNAIR